MNDFKERIKLNIRDEVIAYYELGIPLRKRDPMWDEYVAQCLAEESHRKPIVKTLTGRKRRKPKLTPEQRLARRQKKLAEKQGMSHDEWLKICKFHYRIDEESYTVTSIASGKDKKKVWQYANLFQCEEQVYKLMYWMYYNHYDRETVTASFRYVPSEEELRNSPV